MGGTRRGEILGKARWQAPRREKIVAGISKRKEISFGHGFRRSGARHNPRLVLGKSRHMLHSKPPNCRFRRAPPGQDFGIRLHKSELSKGVNSGDKESKESRFHRCRRTARRSPRVRLFIWAVYGNCRTLRGMRFPDLRAPHRKIAPQISRQVPDEL